MSRHDQPAATDWELQASSWLTLIWGHRKQLRPRSPLRRMIVGYVWAVRHA